MKATLENLLTGDLVKVTSSTDCSASSYGLEYWIDDDGNAYGQCQFGAPLGFRFVDLNPQTEAENIE